MKEEKLILKKQDSFNIIHIFECGQCFRWNKEDDESYTGVIKNGVINVKQHNDEIVFTGIVNGDFEKTIKEYFDLETDYKHYKKTLSKIDEYLKESIEFGDGIRILNQDLWECIISFIISANNNIPRIKKIIDRLSNAYGDRIIWKEKEYYTFPTPEKLSKASIEDLRGLGLGFRDKRVYKTTKMILEKEVDLDYLYNCDDTSKIREELLSENKYKIK